MERSEEKDLWRRTNAGIIRSYLGDRPSYRIATLGLIAGVTELLKTGLNPEFITNVECDTGRFERLPKTTKTYFGRLENFIESSNSPIDVIDFDTNSSLFSKNAQAVATAISKSANKFGKDMLILATGTTITRGLPTRNVISSTGEAYKWAAVNYSNELLQHFMEKKWGAASIYSSTSYFASVIAKDLDTQRLSLTCHVLSSYKTKVESNKAKPLVSTILRIAPSSNT